MHTYATDASDRARVPVYIAVLAVSAALAVHYALREANVPPPWWASPPSVMGVYGVLFLLYDRLLWHGWSGRLKLSAIPDVRGTWAGSLRSSHDEGAEIHAVLVVRQRWSRVLVRMCTKTSRSVSVMAAINTEECSECGLKYEYVNEPSTFSKETMQVHRGTANLRLVSGGTGMEGDYYAGRGRQNIGTVRLTRVSLKPLDFEAAIAIAPKQEEKAAQ